MKLAYAILAILVLAFIESFFDIQEYTTVPLVMFVAGVFGSDLFKMRKKGNTATIISLVLFLVCYTSMLFIEFSEILLWISSSLGSILGMSIGAINQNNSTEEEMA